jgi:hypothetical protein
MHEGNIVLAYKGEISSELLESVYAMMDNHFEEKNIPDSQKKKIFRVLVESLQNVLHHQSVPGVSENITGAFTGFVIKADGDGQYSIVTGNLVRNEIMGSLQDKIDEVNALSPVELRDHYKRSLAESEFSEKGGAGLGIIDMVRKSGNPLKYEFTKIDNAYSFFCLTITISR